MIQELINSKVGGLSKKQIFGKCLMCFVGNSIAAIACAFYIDSHMGSDPISVLLDGMSHTFNISLGTASAINSYTMLILAIIFAFRYINIGTVISAWVWGNVFGWGDVLIRSTMGTEYSPLVQWSMMIGSLIFMCVGLGISISARFGFGGADSCLFRICDKVPKLQYKHVKMMYDALGITVGFLMGGIVGIGTILGLLLTGPGISLVLPISNKYLLPYFDITDPHNEKGNS